MRYIIILSYDGSKFHGFQRQKDVRNVQSELEKYLSLFLKDKVLVKGSGRTDAFVHAYNQVVHFDTSNNIKGLKKYLNNNIDGINIKKIRKVSNTFHARHSVLEKTYLYKIDLSNKLDSNYYLKVKYNLDINKMRDTSKVFIGTHNYKNFVAGKRDNYDSTIYDIKIYKRSNILYLKFRGKAFYRYMVRNIVGALIEVGKNKIDKEVIINMLNNPDIEKRLPTGSPKGLYLYDIKYKKKK